MESQGLTQKKLMTELIIMDLSKVDSSSVFFDDCFRFDASKLSLAKDDNEEMIYSEEDNSENYIL